MGISNPKTNIQILPASHVVTNEEQRILFVAQKTATGTAPAGVLVESIGNLKEEDTLFGADSQLAGAIRAAKRYNKLSKYDVIPLDDNAGGVAAAGSIAFSGDATEAGTYTIYLGSRRNQAFTLSVANLDSAGVVGGNLETLINAKTTCPVNAVNTAGSVALTAVNKGLEGNSIGIEVVGSVAGLTVVVTGMTSGATDPDLTAVFDVVQNIRYQTVVMPVDYLSQAVAVSFLNDRFNTSGDKILDGEGIVTKTDTYANLLTSTIALNSQNYTIIPNETTNKTYYKGSALFELNFVVSAQMAAIRALRLTTDAPLSRFITATEGSNDAYGGIHISTLPYHNTFFPDLPLIDKDLMWSDLERDELKDAGFTIIGNNDTNTAVILDSAITRYKTDAAGDPDLSYKYLNYVDQASAVREYFHNNLKADFRNTRLTSGSLVSGYSMANTSSIRGVVMLIYSQLAALALVPSGEPARKAFLNKLTIEIDEINGKATIAMLDPVITQLREFEVTMQLDFSLIS